MSTEITEANFSKARERKFISINHAADLAPFFAVHEAERVRHIVKGKTPKTWMWDNERTVGKCRQIVWQLTGSWQARRAVSIESPTIFHDEVTRCVTRSARIFNRWGIMALRDMRKILTRRRDKYESIVVGTEEGIKRISKTRPTKQIQPILGSKVMHHFFPSIVPVYDDRWISKKVLKLECFKDFIKNNKDGWVFKDYAEQIRMQEYHWYFAYCAQQICDTKKDELDDLRDQIGTLYKDVSPYSLVKKRKQGLLWKLDAKLAECCLIGATF